MAVIYMPQDPRWQALQQGLAGALHWYMQNKKDQEALKMVAQSLGGQQQIQQGDQSTQPSNAPAGGGTQGGVTTAPTPGQGVVQPGTAPSSGSTTPPATNAASMTGPGGPTPNSLGEDQPPPDFMAAEAAAQGTSPRVQKMIQTMIDAKKWQWQQTELQRSRKVTETQGAERVRQSQIRTGIALEEAQRAAELQPLKVQNEKLGIVSKETTIAKTQQEIAQNAKKFPLIMANERTSLASNQVKLKQLQQEQKTIWSPEEIHRAAMNFAAMGFNNKYAPNFGWGSGGTASAINKNNFWRDVGNLPMTPEQRRNYAAAVELQQTEARRAGTVLTNLTINLNKADQLYKPINQALNRLMPSLSQKGILGNYPMFNRFKKAALTGIGDPAFSGADVLISSFLLTYAKSLNSQSGSATLDLHKTVEAMLDDVSSPQQIKAKMDAILTDMKAERQGVLAGRSQLLNPTDMGQFGEGAAAPQGAGGPAAAPQGKPLETKTIGGKTYNRYSNGWFTAE